MWLPTNSAPRVAPRIGFCMAEVISAVPRVAPRISFFHSGSIFLFGVVPSLLEVARESFLLWCVCVYVCVCARSFYLSQWPFHSGSVFLFGVVPSLPKVAREVFVCVCMYMCVCVLFIFPSLSFLREREPPKPVGGLSSPCLQQKILRSELVCT